jgi:transposase-like protein
MAKTTIASLSREIVTEADAYAYLEKLRWPEGVICPKCHGADVYLIVPKNGISRKATNGTMTERRVRNCRSCRRQFSAISGTMMHGTKVAVRTWVLIILDMIAAKNGISARQVERKYGVCPRTAWFVCHRIRECMKSDGLIASMRGTIVADETYVGGTPKKMNKGTRAINYKLRMTPWTNRAHSGTAKAPVLSLINAETGEVRSRVVRRVDSHNLRKVIAEQVNMAGSKLWTDEGSWYLQIGQEFQAHETVNHSQDEYVDWITGASTNLVESFFSQFKRSLDGTHHHVSEEHLQRYVTEHDFRRTTCKMADADRMALAVRKGDGKRLTYKRISAGA